MFGYMLDSTQLVAVCCAFRIPLVGVGWRVLSTAPIPPVLKSLMTGAEGGCVPAWQSLLVVAGDLCGDGGACKRSRDEGETRGCAQGVHSGRCQGGTEGAIRARSQSAAAAMCVLSGQPWYVFFRADVAGAACVHV